MGFLINGSADEHDYTDDELGRELVGRVYTNMKCAISWIDCNGNPTPDNNEAVGVAIYSVKTAHGETTHSYPVCAKHAEFIGKRRCHMGECGHFTNDPVTAWRFQPLLNNGEGWVSPSV